MCTMFDPKTLHHAYCMSGNIPLARKKLFDFLERELQHAREGNPDFWHGTFESFGIAESRALIEEQLRRAVGGKRRIFVIETKGMTHQAQSALLKVFEEPTEGTHFFLLMTSSQDLLPTLRSRLLFVSFPPDASSFREEAQMFLAGTVPERFAFAKKMADAISDEKRPKSDARELVGEIGRLVAEKEGVNNASRVRLEAIQTAYGYLEDRSASVKMLLEHIAIHI